MQIQAIETEYKGYRFRSRLEARWAVFFDALGIQWEYEKEGYHLSNGSCYLPDFWLPKFKVWAEVKGNMIPQDEAKIMSFAFDDGDAPILVLKSDFGRGELYCNDSNDFGGGGGSYDVYFAYCDECHQLTLIVDDYGYQRGSRTLMTPKWDAWDQTCTCHPCLRRLQYDRVDEASLAAKQARFEHGEKPHLNIHAER